MATVKPPITVESLTKKHGDRALRVYQNIAITGGHGFMSHLPALDPNGYDKDTEAAVNALLNAKTPEDK